ncbi:MAG: hypothetical protein ACE5F1_23235 [Planctomycetota bacterium]
MFEATKSICLAAAMAVTACSGVLAQSPLEEARREAKRQLERLEDLAAQSKEYRKALERFLKTERAEQRGKKTGKSKTGKSKPSKPPTKRPVGPWRRYLEAPSLQQRVIADAIRTALEQRLALTPKKRLEALIESDYSKALGQVRKAPKKKAGSKVRCEKLKKALLKAEAPAQRRFLKALTRLRGFPVQYSRAPSYVDLELRRAPKRSGKARDGAHGHADLQAQIDGLRKEVREIRALMDRLRKRTRLKRKVH